MLWDVRSEMIDNLLEQMSIYLYDLPEMKAFSIFNPKNIPTTEPEISLHGKKDILTVAKYIGYPPTWYDRFQSEWKMLLESFSRSLTIDKDLNLNSKMFWHRYLNMPSNEFYFPPLMKEILDIGLSYALSSSDSERSFSILKLVKTPRRSTTSDKLLDAIINIWWNGPDELAKANVNRVTDLWREKGRHLADDPRNQPKKKHVKMCKQKPRKDGDTLLGKSNLF